MARTIKTYFKEDKILDNYHIFSGISRRIEIGEEEEDYRTFGEHGIEISVLENGSITLFEHDGEDRKSVV
jgi:hypothetical protein